MLQRTPRVSWPRLRFLRSSPGDDRSFAFKGFVDRGGRPGCARLAAQDRALGACENPRSPIVLLPSAPRTGATLSRPCARRSCSTCARPLLLSDIPCDKEGDERGEGRGKRRRRSRHRKRGMARKTRQTGRSRKTGDRHPSCPLLFSTVSKPPRVGSRKALRKNACQGLFPFFPSFFLSFFHSATEIDRDDGSNCDIYLKYFGGDTARALGGGGICSDRIDLFSRHSSGGSIPRASRINRVSSSL